LSRAATRFDTIRHCLIGGNNAENSLCAYPWVGVAEPLRAAADSCRGVREIAALSARSKELMARLESFEINGWEKAYFDRFESEKTLTLSGTVTEFQWTNPRARVMLTVNGTENWTIEMGGLSSLARQGWRSKMLTGMPFTVEIHPSRDGNNGGHLLSAILPDGTQLSGGRDRPVILQEFREMAVSSAARTLELIKKNQLLGCIP
jgi:Family of unknown function (DUF6152)